MTSIDTQQALTWTLIDFDQTDRRDKRAYKSQQLCYKSAQTTQMTHSITPTDTIQTTAKCSQNYDVQPGSGNGVQGWLPPKRPI